ncbi:MAG: glutathione synthase [Acidiferrobacterales bacterium]
MKIKLGVVMDAIESINVKKDTTFAILLEAQSRGWSVSYMQQQDLFLENGQAWATMQQLQVQDNPENWYQLASKETAGLASLDVILMRKDPPFDLEYIYSTYLLELAETAGVKVINKPQSLRDANEKFFIANFPQCITPTIVTRQAERLRQFADEQGEVIFKPLDGMGGASVFRTNNSDPNLNVIIETLTNMGKQSIMGQRYLPEISAGDKRILVIDGKPIPYALARIPAAGENRGNLAAGGTGKGLELTERDKWICAQVGPTLKEKGLLFVGIDVIGDYLTEINVTSPTCLRELDTIFDLNISATFLDSIEETMATS